MKPLNIVVYGMGLLIAANSMPRGIQSQATASSSQISTSFPETSCICAEYIARRVPELGNVNNTGQSSEQDLSNAGFVQTSSPQPGGIALLDKGIPGLTQPDTGHIAFIEDVDLYGIPIITDSNSGGTDSGYGCTNVQTSKRENFLSPGVTFWAKSKR